jgi:aspartyl-tRNA(Asn)/glutamyl-tRNA(Gln) amidotransferase subunit A
MSNDLRYLSIPEAKALLRKGQVSSYELAQDHIKYVHKIEDKIKAFVTITEETALAQSKNADKYVKETSSMDLTGIPMQVKDNMCTNGILTTCSSRMLETFVPPYSATVVHRLKESGAVMIGKGNMDEFAMGSSTENSAFFPTQNPWDITKVPGGSSGGPAAAVAAGTCVYALGSDTGGSIRQPAALCGIVGMKPTYGRVSRYGLVAFGSSLDQIGPMTRDVTDCSIVLNTIAGHDPQDSTSIPSPITDYTAALTGVVKGIKIGIPKEYYGQGIDPEVQAAILKALGVLEQQGAIIEEMSLPHTDYALAVYYILAPSEASTNLARYDGVKYGFSANNTSTMWDAMEQTKQKGFGPEVKRRIMLGTYALSAGYYDACYLKAQKIRSLIGREFQEAFKRYDVIITPTSPTPAFDLGEKMQDPYQMYLSDRCTIPANIAGIPAISIPAGFANKLPIGMQIMGKYMDDQTVLQVAHAYEQSTNWHKKRPKL